MCKMANEMMIGPAIKKQAVYEAWEQEKLF
jgi:hypothetical protein